MSSAEKAVKQHKLTARKRRRNQNDEIEELAELLTFKPDTGKTLDKISVLRLTSSYIKFQNFMKSGERREEEGREEVRRKGGRRQRRKERGGKVDI